MKLWEGTIRDKIIHHARHNSKYTIGCLYFHNLKLLKENKILINDKTLNSFAL